MMPRVIESGVAIVALCALVSPAAGAVHHVPSEYTTINQALDASLPGDTVLVGPGVYNQYETRLLDDGIWYSAVAFLKSGVALVSEAGPSATTLRMDSAATGAHVCRAFGETGTIEVTGFTLTGTTSGINAISISFCDRLIVRDCVVADIGGGGSTGRGIGCVSIDVEVYGSRFENINGFSGAGIFQTSGTLLVEDCHFENVLPNALQVQADTGFSHATSLAVRRSHFVRNTVAGALSAARYSTVLLEDCWFEGNRSENGSAASAGGLVNGVPTTDATVRNCTFVGNHTVVGNGGALRLGCRAMAVEGNTFYGNSAGLDFTPGAAALYIERAVSGILRNNVVASSTGNEAVGIGVGNIETSCNVYWDNPLGNTSGFAQDATDLPADPQFCDAPALDFTVNASSPCIPGGGHPSCTEQIGAWGPGCGVISVERMGWGRIKSGFREGSEETR